MRGRQFGDRNVRPVFCRGSVRVEKGRVGLGWFLDDEGGFTSLAMALALLLSVTLALGTAAAHWSMARAADVQEVADATAMAGSNCVAAFSTVAQVLDACVLTMGLAGVVVCGAGLVVAAIPPLQAKAPAIMKVGKSVLQARQKFSKSAAAGLKKLEVALPALIMANSASCAAANGADGVGYVGMAVPFPTTSQSDWSFLDDDLDADEMEQEAKELGAASKRKDQAHKKAEAAKERAWRADNVNDPLCLWSRASSLAGLNGALNRHYPSVDTWEFEYARVRAHNYYGVRYAHEPCSGDTPDALQRSCARKQFYGYAYEAVGRMSCTDTDTVVKMDLDVLPHTTAMVRDTRLYTDVVWPCTQEEQGRTLHCSLACPGVAGAYAGNASLADVDRGGALLCPVCRMDARAMGNVADASTNIDNGFEHYWRIVVEASRAYEAARLAEIAAEKDMQKAADEGKSAFDKAMEILSVDRPKLCPPGAWGCVSVVCRPQAASVPTELTASFLQGAQLPAGAAVSAATLAPDEATAQNTVIARAFDGLHLGHDNLALDLVGDVTGLWSSLLVGYGSAYGSLKDVSERFIEGVDGLMGEKVATWLRSKLAGLVSTTGLAPADLRLRKPVLVNSQTVLDKAGYEKAGQVRTLIQELPGSPQELVAYLKQRVWSLLGGGTFTIAEVPVPGLEGVSIPLTIDLSQMGPS